MKRTFALILTIVMALSLMAGCSSSNGVGPPLSSISVRSLEELDKMREMISCTDEEKLNEYLRSVEGGGASSREDLISFVDMVDSLPLPELIKGDIIWINRQNNAGNPEDEFVTVSTRGANGDWVRVEYQTSIKDANAEIESRQKEGYFKKSGLDAPVKSGNGRITVYSETKKVHPSGVGNTVTWTIVVDGLLAKVVYYSENIDGICAENIFRDITITTINA